MRSKDSINTRRSLRVCAALLAAGFSCLIAGCTSGAADEHAGEVNKNYLPKRTDTVKWTNPADKNQAPPPAETQPRVNLIPGSSAK